VGVPDKTPLLNQIRNKELKILEMAGPPKYPNEMKYTPIPPGKMKMPDVGEENSYGIVVTPELEKAYLAYLGGRGDEALTSLRAAEQETQHDQLFLWHVSYFRARVLIMMGKAAEAEVELERTSVLEAAVTGGNWNSIALRGEARVWLGDYEAAKNDFFRIIQAVGQWDLPTHYGMPPNNLAELFMTTTAQLRAYTGLAGIYLMTQEYGKAVLWASEAEKRMNAAHYLANHPLYGLFLPTHLDSYYGRAINFTFLAAAQLAQADERAANENFQKAEDAFNAMNYTGGKVLILSLKAQSYSVRGQYNKAIEMAKKGMALAVENGMLDYIWRIETVVGKTYYHQGNMKKAETAFRQAQRSVDITSGSLSTDRAKTRFGSGKEDIPYYLSRIDRRKKDYTALFEDLERGRARSFIDILAGKLVEAGAEKKLVQSIRQLDEQIIRQRLINIAPGLDKRQGVEREKALREQRLEKLKILRERNPELSTTMTVWTHTLPEVRKKLSPGEVIAYALPTRKGDKIAVLFIMKDQIMVKEFEMLPQKLRNDIKNFAARIGLDANIPDKSTRGAIRIVSKKSIPDSSTLSHTIAELQKDFDFSPLGNVSVLYMVPNENLGSMPWGLLDTSYPIVVLPTGGWLNRTPAMITIQRESENVVVGNPDFKGQLPQLPGAEKEAISIGKLLGVTPVTGSDATEEVIRQKVGEGVRILHLATHGVFDQEHPLNSAIFLSGRDKAYPVTAEQLFLRPIPAQTVVLSACETGMGKAVAGQDTLGLLRSFYLGGTLTTLSSLWPVEDEGTRVFMNIFYRYAKEGNYGQGWLTAKKTLQSEGYSPAVYGAFILGGQNTAKVNYR